ncbi:MAG: hypothetical protein R2836_04805 [Chitinophagales bacterium]
MFISIALWNPSFLVTQGSLMIRALLDAEYDFTSGIKDVFNKLNILKYILILLIIKYK